GEGSVGESTMRTWFWKSPFADFSLEYKEGCGRPSEFDGEELKALVEAITRRTVRELVEQL
ncbi:hypothetical protein Angca_003610, partial [Angiostrongylus cantonensis]